MGLRLADLARPAGRGRHPDALRHRPGPVPGAVADPQRDPDSHDPALPQTPRLAWDFLTLAQPDPLNDYFAIADLPRAVGADFVVGGRTYGLFAHDFRPVPVDAWLEVVTERALSQDPSRRPQGADPVALSQPAFTDAVRQALRDLQQPELLARNPLQRTRLVAAQLAENSSCDVVLADLVREAIESLQANPRDHKRWRAMDRTYLRPATTQESTAGVAASKTE